jgi:hypothetical protein
LRLFFLTRILAIKKATLLDTLAPVRVLEVVALCLKAAVVPHILLVDAGLATHKLTHALVELDEA